MIFGQIKPPFGTPLNRSHWAAQGLVALYLMNEGCGDLVHDSCGMNDGKMIGMAPMSSTSGWVPGPRGAALAFPNNAATFVNCGANSIVGSAPLTLMSIFSTKSIGGYSGAIFLGGASRGPYIGTVIGGIGGGFYGANFNTGITTLDTPLCVAMTFAGGTLGAVIIYVNGVNKISSTLTPNTPPDMVKIGRIGTDTTYDFKGLISSVSIYNRALSAEEIAYLYAFPWCMYDSPMSAWEYNQQNRNFDHYYRRLMAA